MPAPIFIGDEVSAAAYRLAGAQVRVPQPEQTRAALREALAQSDLVLITAESAGNVPTDELLRAQAGSAPLLLVVPDVRGRVALPDVTVQLRRQLGLGES